MGLLALWYNDRKGHLLIACDTLPSQSNSRPLPSRRLLFQGPARHWGEWSAPTGTLRAAPLARSILDAPMAGWWDAPADYGQNTSPHQNPTSYFNPQQIPLTAWTLLRSYQALKARGDEQLHRVRAPPAGRGPLRSDYLVRIHRPKGSFLESINAPGREKLACGSCESAIQLAHAHQDEQRGLDRKAWSAWRAR